MLLTESNPIIRHKFTADPTAVVFNDTVYLYTGHDEAKEDEQAYVMNEWLCFSSANLTSWDEHPVPLRATDFSWASGDAYASKIIFHKNTFYWFVSVSNKAGKKAIGVAVADEPIGPFKDAIGKPLITHDMLPRFTNDKANLDPTVLVDDDSSIHIFWGNGLCYHAEVSNDLQKLTSEIEVLDLPGFAEGAQIHKKNEWYYLSYGYGTPERVAYAMSKNINGPWAFKGILNEVAGNAVTNRPCILEFKERDYFFYHNGALPGGGSHRRSVCVDHLYYNEDGTIQKVIMTSEGLLA